MTGRRAGLAAAIGAGVVAVVVGLSVSGVFGGASSPTDGASSPAGAAAPLTRPSPAPSSEVPAPAASESAPADAGAPQDPVLVAAAQSTVVSALGALAGVSEPSPENTDLTAALADVAADSMLAELEALTLELQTNEWTQVGEPKLDKVTVLTVDNQEAPTAMDVSVCVDSSDVGYVDASGRTLPPSATPRATNLFTLHKGSDQVWRVVSRDFPENPAC